MKKILLFTLGFLLIASLIYPATLEMDWMETTCDTDAHAQAAYVTDGLVAEAVDQSQTNSEIDATFGDAGDIEYRHAQSFQVSETTSYSAVEVRRGGTTSGSPSGNWTLRIETDNSGVPSGTLADANASVVVTPPAINTVIKGTFATQVSLSASTTYWLVVLCDNQATNVKWTISCTEPSNYANGVRAYSEDGTWHAQGTVDSYFKIYEASYYVLQSYSGSGAGYVTQGTYSLKGVATTGALNKTLTYTLPVNSNLAGVNNLKFDIRSTRTGGNLKLGIHDTGGTTTEITPTISAAGAMQRVNWNISGVTDANKDAINTAIVTITNADSANEFYVDFFDIAQCIDVFGLAN